MDGSHQHSGSGLWRNHSAKLLYEMLHAFGALGRTCNLSIAAKELSTTRQTIRRHINQLEEIRGAKLFRVQNRAYTLTEEGEVALPAALDIISRCETFLLGSGAGFLHLPRWSSFGPDDFYYLQERQSAERIWDKNSGLFRGSLQRWAIAAGDVEHQSMKEVRERSLVCRMNAGSWICTEVGDLSYYSKWWGWAKARSSVGRNINAFPLGSTVGEILERTYREVSANMAFVFDQVATVAPRTDYEGLQPMYFDRLLLGVRFPDRSTGIMIIVDGAETEDMEVGKMLPISPAESVRVRDLDHPLSDV